MSAAPPTLPGWILRVLPAGRAAPKTDAVPVPLGAAFLLDQGQGLILTCAHVVGLALDNDAGLRIARASSPPAGQVLDLQFMSDGAPVRAEVSAEGWSPYSDQDPAALDVALLTPCDAAADGRERAILRRRPAGLLAGRDFRTYGFPLGAPEGWQASATVIGAAGLGGRWLQVEVKEASGARVEQGFSGAPVWDARSGEVIAMVAVQDPREARRIAGVLPALRLIEATPALEPSVSVLLDGDPERSRHWRPRARGVTSEHRPGWYFTGRDTALRELVAWLSDPGSGSRLRVVTGHPGAGKSALLARLVTLSDRRTRREVPDLRHAPSGTVPELGAIDAAIHARNKPARAIAQEIADRLELPLDGTGDDPRDLAQALAGPLEGGAGAYMIALDALDEADPASDAATFARELVRETTRTRLLVATRRPLIATLLRDAQSNMLRQPLARGEIEGVIDLNGAEYQTRADLVEYAARRLLDGPPEYARPAPGSGEESLARCVAEAISDRAGGLFLVAQLTCEEILAAPPRIIDVTAQDWRTTLPVDIAEAFARYLDRLGEDEPRARALLTALAFGGAGGLPANEVWRRLACALTQQLKGLTMGDVHWLIGDEGAASYLTESLVREDRTRVFRLYHQELDATLRDSLVKDQSRLRVTTEATIHARIADELLRLMGAGEPWDPYVLEGLPRHLGSAGRASELIDMPELLLRGDRQALRSALLAASAQPSAELEGARGAIIYALARPLAGLSSRAVALVMTLARQGERARAKEIEQTAGLGSIRLLSGPPLPAQAVGAIPSAHAGGIEALALSADAAGPLVLSAGDDGAIRSWRLDGAPGPLRLEEADDDWIQALAVSADAAGPLVLSAGDDGAIRSWRLDGAPGPLRLELAHDGPILALAVSADAAGPLVLSAGDDGAIRSWRLDGAPGPLRLDEAHDGWILALAVSADAAGPLVLSAGDGAIGSWRLDGAPGPLRLELAHDGPIRALGLSADAAGPLVLSAGDDRAIRSWRLHGAPGPLRLEQAHDGWILALAVSADAAGPLVLSAGDDGAIRSWRLDGASGPLRLEQAHDDSILALALSADAAGPLVLSAGHGDIRSWRLHGAPGPLRPEEAHAGPIRALGLSADAAGPLVLSAGDDRAIRSWRLDGAPGPLCLDEAHAGPIRALALSADAAGPLVLSAGDDRAIRSWRLDGAPGPLRLEQTHDGWIRALAVSADAAGPLVLSAGDDGAIRSWRLHGVPGPLRPEEAYARPIRALALSADAAGPLVLSAGDDRAIRSWRLDGAPGPLRLEEAHDGWILALAVSADAAGPLVLSAGDDGAIRSWRLDGAPGPLRLEQVHDGPILALALSADAAGPLVLSAGDDRAIRSWRLDGAPGPLALEEAHAAPIWALAVSRDAAGPLVISAGDDRELHAVALPG